MDDHDRMLVLETQVNDIRSALDRQTQVILDRIDDLETHWRRTCDVRHGGIRARTTWILTCVAIAVALLGSTVSRCSAIDRAAQQVTL